MIYSKVQLFKALSISGGGLQYEDDLHKPLLASGDIAKICSGQDPAASIAGPIVPRNGQEFREMIIDPLRQIDLLSPPHFLKADTAVGTVYGWIDRVTPLHESDRQWSYRLEWHPDWWLTAQSLGKLGFGQGRILKAGPEVARPSAVEPRMWVYEKEIAKFDKFESERISSFSRWAVLVRIGKESAASTKTEIFYEYWPVDGNLNGGFSDTTKLDEIYSGFLDEAVGGTPENLLGCWISPFAPFTNSNSIIAQRSKYEGSDKQPTYLKCRDPKSGFYIERLQLDSPVMTDDRRKIVFLDCARNPVFTAPWGIRFQEIDSWIDIGVGSAYMTVYLNPTINGNIAGKEQEGRIFSIPLPALPITGNSWSSYVYSGQRSYDIASKNIQRQESAVSGLENIGTSAISGAIAGTMAAPGIGTVAGLIGGAAAGGISTGLGYFTSEKYDSRLQKSVDRLRSNQTSGVLFSAGGAVGINPPEIIAGAGLSTWSVVSLIRDPVSLAELDTAQSELGYDTDFYAADCSQLIGQGGPLQISGLQVKGDMPAEGKQYISALFARGVHIDIIR